MIDIDCRLISRKKISVEELLGEGAFGHVYKGTWTLGKGRNASVQHVAIKVLKNSCFLGNNAWKDEVKRMNQLNHPNILTLFGVSFTPNGYDDTPWMIMEYMVNRDLHSYISSYPGGGLSFTSMVKFAYGIACGMEYLHHEVRQLHGDLAARNCLLGPNFIVKIGDFGKFEETYEDCYYDAGQGYLPCPIRWMPPENIPTWSKPKPVFTRKGDIWAYGVLLYEIWSRARLPFYGLTDQGVINALGNSENPREHYPVKAKWYIISMMDRCWEINPQERPNFKSLKRTLEENASDYLNS